MPYVSTAAGSLAGSELAERRSEAPGQAHARILQQALRKVA